ncbi:MAG: phosphotransferase [Burkholderiaceae bacterium]|mgnify:CR=1 FL=1|nr:phosphotransferase [Burkholderiaceae bacterium]ODS98603.1 MAG: aminoglycoside phosphotransferase [Lautropia sp. SCN 69-89]
MTSSSHDTRLAELHAWLAALDPEHGLALDTIRPASDDASFRRYFRIDASRAGAPSLVAMDAPPPMEDCRPFVHAARVFAAAGVSVPAVRAADLERGFLLLDDFGSTTYLSRLGTDDPNADAMYRDAIDALLALQAASRPGVFPDYDRALLGRELELFPDWYLARHRAVTPDAAMRACLESAFERLLANNLAQGRVYVHRDYHSRNLMVLDRDANPGILDFQDAVHGPVTYDLVSLLRDAYVAWPEERQLDWAARYWEGARRRALPVPAAFDDFYRDFEWMGLQRHLKVLGIFARLNYRDGKDRYLADMPLVLDYVLRTARRYGEFDALTRLIEDVERGADNAPARAAGYTF